MFANEVPWEFLLSAKIERNEKEICWKYTDQLSHTKYQLSPKQAKKKQ